MSNDRAERAVSAAHEIERALKGRMPDASIHLQVSEPPNGFDILWNGESAGKLHVWIPLNTFGQERTKYALRPARSEKAPRTYVKVATLLDKIVELCRPLTGHEADRAERQEKLQELNRSLQEIEGDNGSIGRYLHIHRRALASWLVRQADVPIELRWLVERLRELAEEASRLRGEIAIIMEEER